MTDGIIFLVIAGLMSSALITVVKEKKKGKRCIGCSEGSCCCKNKKGKK